MFLPNENLCFYFSSLSAFKYIMVLPKLTMRSNLIGGVPTFSYVRSPEWFVIISWFIITSVTLFMVKLTNLSASKALNIILGGSEI